MPNPNPLIRSESRRLTALRACVAGLALASLAACASTPPTLASAPSPAPAAKPAGEPLPDAPLSYRKHILANGLTLLVHEDRKAPLVAVHLMYHVGSQDEKPGKTGFAHLFEHLMFNGSQHHDDEFFRPLESAGASAINGTTNADRTNFYETVPTEALDLALWLESDRMGHLLPAITQAKLDEQRGVVKNEKRQRESQPYGKVDELITQAMYPAGHPYSWTTIGSMEDLDRASLADVQEWFRNYYGPSNATLVLAGDISFEDAVARVEKAFGSIPPGPPVLRRSEWVAPLDGPRRLSIEDKVTLPRLYRVWNLPPRSSDEVLMLDLASDVLASDKASRLYRRLVTRDGLATGVSAGIDPGSLGSQFVIMLSLKPDADRAQAAQALDEELARFAAAGPEPAELDRLRTRAYVARLAGREAVGQKAAELANCQVLLGAPEACERQWQVQRDATPAQVQAAVARWLGPAHLDLQVLPEPPLKAAAGADLDRRQLPVVGDPAGIRLPPLKRFTLSNGIEVLLAERHEVPLVRMALLFPWGTRDQPEAGQMEMLLGMLSEGAAGLSAEQLTEAYGDLGASFGIDPDADATAITLGSTRVKLAESLQLFVRNLREPTFPADALQRRQQRKLAGLRANTASASGILGLNQYRLMFGDHPYGRFNSLPRLEAATQSLTTERLRELYGRFLRPDGLRVLVVGDTDPASLQPLLEQSLGQWPAARSAARTESLPPATPPAPRIYLFDKPGAEQSLIAAADLAPPSNDPQREAMELANAVLGGLFTSRLNLNLREDKHWSYGASTGFGDSVGPSLFTAQASVETAHTADSLREARQEIASLGGKRPPTEAELDAARKALIRSLPSEAETAGGVLGLYQRLLIYGLPADHYDGYAKRLAALDSKAVAAAARRLARPDSLSWFVVGDLAKIEASVRALKWAPVTVLAADGTVLRQD